MLEYRILKSLAAAGKKPDIEPGVFENREIYNEIEKAFLEGKKPDIKALGLEGYREVEDIQSAVEELREEKRKSRLSTSLLDIWNELPEKSTDEVLGKLSGLLSESVPEKSHSTISAGDPEVVDRILSWLRELQRKRSITGSPVLFPSTGIGSLDEYTSGLQPGTMWLIVGSPGVGKTMFTTQVAVNSLYSKNTAVLYITAEDPVEKILLKAWCNYYGIQWNSYVFGLGDMEALEKASSEFSALSDRLRFIQADGEIKERKLNAEVQQLKKHTGAGHVIVIADYLQAMAENRKEDEDMRHKVSNEMKKLGKVRKEHCTVLVNSAMNRSSYKDTKTLGAPRETSTAEYNTEIFLRLDKTDDFITLGVLKNRLTGITGQIKLEADFRKSAYTEKIDFYEECEEKKEVPF
ncbi:MAG: AAA family ATPase [Clostridiales bacterium]|nr:AAA family ATPase [Clostridiales bacterium]MCF8022699.1 AAA family ATPase [Clostridiales bacterium]